MDCSSELMNIIAADCKNTAVAGTFGEVVLIPYNTVDHAGSEVTDNVISSIAVTDGKGYKFTTFDNAPLGASSLVSGTYVNTVQQDLTLRVFVKNEQVKQFVNAFLNARVVAVVKNKENGGIDDPTVGETKYEAYGWDAGLVLTGLTSDTTMADGVVYELVAGNDETSKEKTLPKSVWAGDLKDTETMLDTLVQ